MPDGEQPAPWRWDRATIEGHVTRVRAGATLLGRTPEQRWPGGARCAVALSFDADHETLALRDNRLSPAELARGEYGARVGIPRILSLLAEYNTHATFFVPAVSALLHPTEIPHYRDGGHEIGVHGWIHERSAQLRATEEYELTARAIDVLEEQSGERPVGIRTPSWDFTNATLGILQRLGIRYDSSLMADDYPYELLGDGERTGIVEIPVDWARDDFPYFDIDVRAGALPRMTPDDVSDIWREEFDAAYRDRGVFELTMHPHIIGHHSRLAVLRNLLDYISSFPRVWFTTHAGLAHHLTTPPQPKA